MNGEPAEQATVHLVHRDGSMTLLRDDGVLIEVTAAAVAAGGWRSPRPGQRVALHRAGGTITEVTIPVPASPTTQGRRVWR